MFGSLTARAIAASLVWISVALGIGGWLIVEVFRESTTRQFDRRLESQIALLTAAVAASPEDPGSRMTDPGFQRVYSGLYWQVSDAGLITFRSRSLWDVALPMDATAGRPTILDVPGPENQVLRLIVRRVNLPSVGNWILTVAADRQSLDKDIARFRRKLLAYALGMGFTLLIAAFGLLRAAFRPLKALQSAVVERHSGDADKIVGNFPNELAPLVEDLNSLLDRNERLREKGRIQAANLAHALKTPAAILRNELYKARRGEPINLEIADQALENVAAAADRHLSLVVPAPDEIASAPSSDLAVLADEVARAIGRMFPGLSFDLATERTVPVPMARSEAVELMGNLIENAAKWADLRVRIGVLTAEGTVQLIVEDDGAGVPEESRERILEPGFFLDRDKSGSGLGLTIVADILERHAGAVDFGASDMGGLSVRVTLPINTAG